jgi:aryl carrier-like protein
MIWKDVISISAMPRTATGKLDRRSVKSCIPDTGHEKSSEEGAVDATVQMMQDIVWPSKIAESNFDLLKPIWSKILRIEPEEIDVRRSWTDAGGDSLSAMMFVREVRKLGYQLSSSELMSDSSFVELCNMFRRQHDTVAQSDGTPDDTMQVSDGYNPVTDFQRFYLSRSQSLGSDQLYKYDIALRGGFDRARLHKALRQWVREIEALRLSFSSSGEQHITQSVISPTNKDWENCLCQHRDEDQLTSMSADHDFFTHPVLVSLEHNGASPSEPIRLAVHIHHGIFDGLSWNLLLDDLISAYQDGKIPPRPSFLGYLQRHLNQRSLESIKYWQVLLRDSSLATLRMDPELSFYGAECASGPEHVVSRAVYLEANSHRKAAATMSTFVQTAWSIVLSVMSGHDDVLFLYLVHGRDEIIGCCVAECPLRVQLNKSISIADLTALVQKQAMSSTPHAHLGSNTIGTQCTDWPSKERLYHHSSFVLHQTVVAKDHIVVGDTGYIDVGEPEVEHKLTYDFDLATSSSGPGELSFKLRCLRQVYTAQEVGATADAFSMTLRMLTSGTGKVGDLQQQLARLPFLPSMKAEMEVCDES